LTSQLDASVFDYDSVYDNMQAAKLAAQATRKAESADKKVGTLGLLTFEVADLPMPRARPAADALSRFELTPHSPSTSTG